MEPMPTAGSGEPKERRKIQFSVPAPMPSQLDPRQVEMIRRRRPTPATLFRVSDNPSPEEEHISHQWVVGENGILKPKRSNPCVYHPPSLRAVQRMAQAHMQALGASPPLEDPPEGVESEDGPPEAEMCEDSPCTPAESPEETKSDPESGALDEQQDPLLTGSEVTGGEEAVPQTPEPLGKPSAEREGEESEERARGE
ncbi:protein phosphatase 1 regulatory subunit 1B [Lepisosteus oculatus]|uniref:protein phosphatase 1 regulatory subunit 1B n=1 Tax=Lepisosteus oculatus TaxID=7918 RepID=UPI00371A737B